MTTARDVSAGGLPADNHHLPHLVGLRGVAVLVIMLFHLNVPFARGGYVGVDVFFVLSGFLITRMLLAEYGKTGRVDFAHFYLRRARRLLPALSVTIAFTLLAAFFLFTPQDFQATGNVAWRSALGISNFQFWRESDYFDTASSLKPLLHTWSLGVEEQFYLLWPALLFLLAGPRKRLPLYAAIGLLWAAGYLLLLALLHGHADWAVRLSPHFSNRPATAFYLLPFRAFEFLLGALTLFFHTRTARLSSHTNAFLACIGWLFVLLPVWQPTDVLPDAALWNLIPCLGAAILICTGNSALTARLLDSRVLRFLGTTSYSLYLVHWPVIVFTTYYYNGKLAFGGQLFATGFTLLGTLLLYFGVETRFQEKFADRQLIPGNRCFVLAGIAAAAALVMLGTTIDRQRGWIWRIPEEQRILAEALGSNPRLFHRENFGGARHYGQTQLTPVEPGKLDLLLIGDSHIEQYTEGLYEIFFKRHARSLHLCSWSQIFLPGFKRTNKDENFHRQFETQLQLAVDTARRNPKAVLILGEDWVGQLRTAALRQEDDPEFRPVALNEQGLAQVLVQIRQLHRLVGWDRKIVIFGCEPGSGANNQAVNVLLRPQYLKSHAELTGGALYGDDALNQLGPKINAWFATNLSPTENLHFLDPGEVLVREGQALTLLDKRLLYSDGSHLSLDGSKMVIAHFESRLLAIITQEPNQR